MLKYKAFPSFRLNEKVEPIDSLEKRFQEQKKQIEKLDIMYIKLNQRIVYKS